VVVPGDRDTAVARRGETATDPASGPEELAEAVAGLD